MKRICNGLAAIVLALPILAGAAGTMMAGGMLHPMRRELSPKLIEQADAAFRRNGAKREDFEVRARDGVQLRGWKVRPPQPNSDWVLLSTAFPTTAPECSATRRCCCAIIIVS